MAYQITRTDGSSLLMLEDGIVDNTTSLQLVGRNVVNYGTVQNENFVKLLENFASVTAPTGAISGQVWYDYSVNRLKVYDSNTWNQMPAIIAASTATGQTIGDLWLNTLANTLNIKTASGYVRIGPNPDVASASKLTTPVTINNVSFDGSSNIVVSSTTTYKISAGDYLTGSDFNGAEGIIWAVDVGVPGNATPLTVVARDSNGDINFATGHGIAMQARFADLAEKYLIDGDFEVGTVVSIGGPLDMRPCKQNDRAVGVVSGNPAYLMNKDLVGGTPVALKGRVPTNTRGIIKKGDQLIAGADGRAVSIGPHANNPKVFAIALEDSNGNERVEALVL